MRNAACPHVGADDANRLRMGSARSGWGPMMRAMLGTCSQSNPRPTHGIHSRCSMSACAPSGAGGQWRRLPASRGAWSCRIWVGMSGSRAIRRWGRLSRLGLGQSRPSTCRRQVAVNDQGFFIGFKAAPADTPCGAGHRTAPHLGPDFKGGPRHPGCGNGTRHSRAARRPWNSGT